MKSYGAGMTTGELFPRLKSLAEGVAELEGEATTMLPLIP